MKTITSLVCISLVALLSACATPDAGYYDANGNWIANNPNNANRNHAPLPGGTRNSQNSDYDNGYPATTTTTVTTYNYDRRGYYDENGHYMAKDDSLNVPTDMFPPRGMCRVWFTDRDADNQPDIESCKGIKSHVPAGAYVIYGG